MNDDQILICDSIATRYQKFCENDQGCWKFCDYLVWVYFQLLNFVLMLEHQRNDWIEFENLELLKSIQMIK